MLIAGILILVSVLTVLTLRWLYAHSHAFFFLCTAIERFLVRRNFDAPGAGGADSTSRKARAAAP